LYHQWNIDGQLQDTSGDTEVSISFLSATSRLSFTDELGSLGTIIGIAVDGIVDVSGIGFNFCHSPVNWKFDDTLTVNGVEYDLPKIISNTPNESNPATGEFVNRGLRFEPSVVERLLENQGVTLRTGDQIKWKVTGSNTLTIAEGHLINTFTREPLSNTEFLSGDSGTCLVSSSSAFVSNTQSDSAITIETESGVQGAIQTGVIAYSIGKTVEFDMIWIDPTDELLNASNLQVGQLDFDNDGIPDDIDQCTFTAENLNGFEDDDGCPDVIPPPTITVTEGDVEIEIPVEVGDDEIVVINAEGEVIVIKNLDFDNDGIPNDIDDCPNQQGIPALNGCPDTSGTVDQTEFLQAFFDRIEANNPQTNVHIDLDTGIETEKGVEGICDNATEDCGDIITQAFRDLERFSGIKLPFQPTILNFMIIFGVVAGVVVVIAKVTKKI